MGDSDIECDESEWTSDNILRLFTALKTSIPNRDKNVSYIKGLKNVKWETVAFPPFSPSECKEKWMEILQKLGKLRSLTELIVEAESSLKSMGKFNPKAPQVPNVNAIFMKENYAKFKREHPGMQGHQLFTLINREFSQLSKGQKAKYEKKAQLAKNEYYGQMNQIRKECLQTANRKRKRDEDELHSKLPVEQHAEPSVAPPAKPPSSGFHLFLMNRTSKHSEMLKRWQEMSETQREEYRTRCTTMKMEYSLKSKDYVESLDPKEKQQMTKTHEIKRTKEMCGKPKFPARTNILVFLKKKMNQLRQEIPVVGERFTKVCQMWANLPKSQKDKYTNLCNAGILKYQYELQQWFESCTPNFQANYLKHNPKIREYLDLSKANCSQQLKLSGLPSDSEDENIVGSSDDEEDDNDIVVESAKDAEQEQEVSFTFEMY